jgi:hypothetical protein
MIESIEDCLDDLNLLSAISEVVGIDALALFPLSVSESVICRVIRAASS